MPKTAITPFTYYTFRYDYQSEELVDKIRQYIEGNIPSYAIFKEISSEVGKKHIQGKIGKSISLIQLRKHFKDAFPGVFVASNYSITDIKDPEKYDSYICKDGNVLCNNIFSSDYIQEQVQIHLENNFKFETKKQKAAATKTFTEKVFSDFVSEYPLDVSRIQYLSYKAGDKETEEHRQSCEKLLAYLLRRLGNAVKVFDDNMLQRMYNGIKNSILQLDVNASSKQLKIYSQRIQL